MSNLRGTEYTPVQADPATLAPSEYHVRGETPVGEHLATSVAGVGIVEPPIIRREGGEYRVLDGMRRIRAAADAGIGEIDCLSIDCSAAEAVELSLSVNLSHTDEPIGTYDRRNALSRLSDDPAALFHELGGDLENRCRYCWRQIENAGARTMHERHCNERTYRGAITVVDPDEDGSGETT